VQFTCRSTKRAFFLTGYRVAIWLRCLGKPRECKLMFERNTRDRGALWRRGERVRARFTPVWSARRSFIFIAAGTVEEPDCRQATPRLRFRAGCSGARSAPLKSPRPVVSSLLPSSQLTA
jgi:hypothetical protein